MGCPAAWRSRRLRLGPRSDDKATSPSPSLWKLSHKERSLVGGWGRSCVSCICGLMPSGVILSKSFIWDVAAVFIFFFFRCISVALHLFPGNFLFFFFPPLYSQVSARGRPARAVRAAGPTCRRPRAGRPRNPPAVARDESFMRAGFHPAHRAQAFLAKVIFFFFFQLTFAFLPVSRTALEIERPQRYVGVFFPQSPEEWAFVASVLVPCNESCTWDL